MVRANCGREKWFAMPLRGRKRKGYVRKEESAEEVEDGEEERQEEGERLRAGNEIGAKAKDDAIFAAGRFHDLGLAPALSDHIHG